METSAAAREEPAGSLSARRPLEALLGVPFTEGNDVAVLHNGDQMFPALLEAIRASTTSIDLLWFLWGTGQITEMFIAALAERARAGVRVRLLLDGFGSRAVPEHQVGELRDAGCDVAFFRPLHNWRITDLNLRTHRRVLVCDGTVGFTGGPGIDHEWAAGTGFPGPWRDTGYRLRGPAVDGLRGAFAKDWLQTSHPLSAADEPFPAQGSPGDVAVQVISPNSQPGWNASALALLTLLDLARHRVRVASPYVRLPERFHRALAAAVQRGLQVQLLVSGPYVDRQLVAAQSRHHYGRLLESGVELWLYQPTLLHTKVVTVDSSLAFVGTTNLDVRSFGLNEQVGLVLDDRPTTAVLDGHFDDDLAHSVRLREEQWRGRGAPQRLVEAAASVLGTPLQGLQSYGQSGRRP